ncbi:RdgB/HAM1 family non-canonical purine NTP pyrophosphatase [Dinoroseobacter sp. S375]|uniref:RdgB/HAM1 family non-canonical purine NTP pyrophosphatase n=1 Tax=Dinoroseobacter sp. S375 TaxID=3415136 RepID=UPI003C7C7995
MTLFADKTLLVASHNKGKIEEIAHLLEPYGIAVTSAAEHGLSEPEETETSFVGNARIKAHYAAKETGLPALADDSGLEVDALDGAPGVYTADWAETTSGRDFKMAMAKVHDALLAKGAAAPWRARFCCTLVLALPDGTDHVFPGTMDGQLVWPMRGDQGHGYDPVFQPDGYDITFGEMDRWEKNKISHRADAFAKFKAACFPEGS